MNTSVPHDTAVPTIIIPSMNPVLRELSASFIPPHWPVIVKDGNPLKHFAELKTLDITTRWAINVDEDCFLIDPDGILALIATMEAEGYDMAAVQDGASNLRQHNPVIFNPYFFVFDVAKVQAAPTDATLDPAAESHKFSHLVRFADGPFSYDGFEPYYPFFIDLLHAGLRPLYLNNHAYEAFQPREYDLGKPSIVLGEDGRELAIHSWYSRLWHMPVVQDRIRVCTEYAMANPHCLRHADRPLPPEPLPDSATTLGIVTLQHNRGPHLTRWFAFHHALGFRKFYFYADRCTDDTWQRLLELAPKLDITVYTLTEEISHGKLTAYQHACTTHLAEVDWMAFIDGDEYLFPLQPGSMQRALDPYRGQALSALAVYVAPIDGDTPATAQTTAQYSAQALVNHGVASLVRGKATVTVTATPQIFNTELGTLDELMRPLPASAPPAYPPSYRHFQVSRYPVEAAGHGAPLPWVEEETRKTLAWLSS